MQVNSSARLNSGDGLWPQGTLTFLKWMLIGCLDKFLKLLTGYWKLRIRLSWMLNFCWTKPNVRLNSLKKAVLPWPLISSSRNLVTPNLPWLLPHWWAWICISDSWAERQLWGLKTMVHTSEGPVLQFSEEGKVKFLLCLGWGGENPIKSSCLAAIWVSYMCHSVHVHIDS